MKAKEFEKNIENFTNKINAEERLAAEVYARDTAIRKYNIDKDEIKEIQTVKQIMEITGFSGIAGMRPRLGMQGDAGIALRNIVDELQQRNEIDFFWNFNEKPSAKEVNSKQAPANIKAEDLAKSCFFKGLYLLHRGKDSEALVLFERAEYLNYLPALPFLGLLYGKLHSANSGDDFFLKKAIKYLFDFRDKLPKLDDYNFEWHLKEYILAVYSYEQGLHEEALKHYKSAAKGHISIAKFALAMVYKKGELVAQDLNQYLILTIESAIIDTNPFIIEMLADDLVNKTINEATLKKACDTESKMVKVFNKVQQTIQQCASISSQETTLVIETKNSVVAKPQAAKIEVTVPLEISSSSSSSSKVEEEKLGPHTKQSPPQKNQTIVVPPEFSDGFIAFHNGRYKEAFTLFLKAYNLGYKPAVCYLASLHQQGLEVEKIADDKNKYLEWAKELTVLEEISTEATQSLQGKYNLAFYYQIIERTPSSMKNALTIYSEIIGPREDFVVTAAYYTLGKSYPIEQAKLSLSLFAEAARRGLAKAQFTIGFKGSEDEGIGWWIKAGEQGLFDAQFSLAKYFVNNSKPHLAAFWYLKALVQAPRCSPIAASFSKFINDCGDVYIDPIQLYSDCVDHQRTDVFCRILDGLKQECAINWLTRCLIKLSKQNFQALIDYSISDQELIAKYIEIMSLRMKLKKEPLDLILEDLNWLHEELNDANSYLYTHIVQSICAQFRNQEKDFQLIQAGIAAITQNTSLTTTTVSAVKSLKHEAKSEIHKDTDKSSSVTANASSFSFSQQISSSNHSSKPSSISFSSSEQ
jgi:TPR repeat protein